MSNRGILQHFLKGECQVNRKKLILAICLLILMVLAAGCAQANQAQGTPGSSGVAGFWAGLWQGFILPVSFIISLFKSDVGIYEIHNNGNLYNLGFVIGTWIIFSAVLASKNKR